MNNQNSIKLVIFGFLTLLLSSFFDNIRGPLLVPMVSSMGLTLADGGVFLGVGQIGAAMASLLLLRLQKSISDRSILIGAFILAVLVGSGAWFVNERIGFLFLALFTGFIVTALGTMCNILVILGSPTRLLGKILSGLHGMYGVGSFLGTLVAGQLLLGGYPWNLAFVIGSGAAFVMAILILSQFPAQESSSVKGGGNLGAPRWAHLIVVVTFALYVGAEISLSMWMPAFLTKARGLTSAEGAQYASFYFLVMTGSRLGCAFFVKPAIEKPLALGCLMMAFAAFWYAYLVDYRFLVLTGLLGPFYPIFFSMVSKTFNKSWRILATLIMLGVNGFVGVANLSLGKLSDTYGVGSAYLLGPMLIVLATIMLVVYFATEKNLVE